MAKIVLGKRPRNFKRSIKVDLPEGGVGEVEVSFIYRTRTEFGAFIDSMMADAGVKQTGQSDDEQKFSLEQALAKTREANADYIMKVADGWNLEAEFSRDTVAQLCDELPGVAMEIMNVYRAAITEGRLGN